MVGLGQVEKRGLLLLSELAASSVMARPGRLAALVLGMAAALLAALMSACTAEVNSTPLPPPP